MRRRPQAEAGTVDVARGIAGSMTERLGPGLQEGWGGGVLEVKLMTQNIAWDAVQPPTTEDTAEAGIVENLETALIFHAQWLSFTAVEQDVELSINY